MEEQQQFLTSVDVSVSNMRRDLRRNGVDVPDPLTLGTANDAHVCVRRHPRPTRVSRRAPRLRRRRAGPSQRRRPHQPPPRRAAQERRVAPPRQGRRARHALARPLALRAPRRRRRPHPPGLRPGRPHDARRRGRPVLGRRRRGAPRPGRAPGPLPLRPPLPLPHGVAPGRDRALAGAPRRQGRPRARLFQPPVADRPPSPTRALRLHLRHPPAPRHVQRPQHRRAPARHTLPLPPGACPRHVRHRGTRPPLPDRPEPRPGGPHHHHKPDRGSSPADQPQPAVRAAVQVSTSAEVHITVVDAPRLERLLMWMISPAVPGESCSSIKIGHAPNLCMLGHWQPGFELEIGNTILKVGTKMSPSTMVPTVKILALEVGFEVHNEVKMMPCFLKCFPNVQTLLVFSVNDAPSGKVDPKFWKGKEAGCIDCVQRHVKKFVFQEFQGKRSELAFLKFIAERGQVLEKMVVTVASKCFSSADAVNAKLKSLTSAMWASKDCKLIVFKSPSFDGVSPAWASKIASNFSCSDPFDLLTANAELYSGASVLQHSSTL